MLTVEPWQIVAKSETWVGVRDTVANRRLVLTVEPWQIVGKSETRVGVRDTVANRRLVLSHGG